MQATQSIAETKACKSVFFSPTQEKLKNKKSPPLQKIKLRNRTVLNLTVPTSIVRVLRRKFCADIGQTPLRTRSRAAANIKIKRNNFFEGFVGYRSVVLLMKCVQEKIFATEENGVNDFIYLLQKFSRTVSLLILQKNYFVNPFFVIANATRRPCNDKQTNNETTYSDNIFSNIDSRTWLFYF